MRLYTASLVLACAECLVNASALAAPVYRGEHAYVRKVSMEERDFTAASVRRCAARFVREVGDRHRFAVLELVPPSGAVSFGPVPEGSWTLAQAEKEQQENAKVPRNIARVLIRNGRAVLQVRYQSGRIERIVLGAYDDPLIFHVGNLDFQLVDIWVNPCTSLNRAMSPPSLFHCSRETIGMMFRSPRVPTMHETTVLWQHLRAQLGTELRDLELRRVAKCGDGSGPPPFEDPSFIQCKDWRQEPWAAMEDTGQFIIQTLLDGRQNERVQLDSR